MNTKKHSRMRFVLDTNKHRHHAPNLRSRGEFRRLTEHKNISNASDRRLFPRSQKTGIGSEKQSLWIAEGEYTGRSLTGSKTDSEPSGGLESHISVVLSSVECKIGIEFQCELHLTLWFWTGIEFERVDIWPFCFKAQVLGALREFDNAFQGGSLGVFN